MDFEWVAIAMGDVTWLTVAFILGYLAQVVRLPPLIGFLAAGFTLNAFGFTSGEMLHKISDLGITLLLFAVGLKLDIKSLLKPQVWGVTTAHMAISISIIAALLYLMTFIGLSTFVALDIKAILIIAFALSFSSTVFAVKLLEEKFELASLHGRLAIGILVMQDLLAVLFLAASEGKLPTLLAPLLIVALVLAKPLLFYFLRTAGHGELLILYALVLALGGAELFELVGIKDDLGALFLGVLIASSDRSKEMAKAIMSFKDLFLVGFFLTIGMGADITFTTVLIGLLLLPLIFAKSALFFWLMTRLKIRARTALLTSVSLTNYSEFGLIVAAIGVANGWLASEWLLIIALALSFSFVAAAPLGRIDHNLFQRFHDFWIAFQTEQRLLEDQNHDIRGSTVAVIGMGRVGEGAYDNLREQYGDCVIGIDFDQRLVDHHQLKGRHAIRGNPADPDFWDNFTTKPDFNLILLTLPKGEASLEVINLLRQQGYDKEIAVTARYPEDEECLRNAGIKHVYNIYENAGMSFAQHVIHELAESK